jgi:DNA-binding CsgD family transcriptional regulator
MKLRAAYATSSLSAVRPASAEMPSPATSTMSRRISRRDRSLTGARDDRSDVLCRVHDLRRRARRLTALVLHGFSTEQIARALHISPYTVKDHLKAIFDKTGIRRRRELISEFAARSPARPAVTPPGRH